MIVKKYRSVVKDIKNPLEGIYVVTFTAIDKDFKFKPGQFLHLALDEYDPSRQWPESRCFSMQSSPNNISEITITYAVKGAFTGRMSKALHVGTEVWLKLPYGEIFTEEHPRENAVFIAGGTGITPFLSLFTDTSFGEYVNPVLYLGVRSSSYNIYQIDIERAKGMNESFQIKLVDQEKHGILDIDTIYRENPESKTYFISGPPGMIKSFKKSLAEKGVNASSIRTDDWE